MSVLCKLVVVCNSCQKRQEYESEVKHFMNDGMIIHKTDLPEGFDWRRDFYSGTLKGRVECDECKT